MMNNIPNFLYERLLKQYGEKLTESILNGFSVKRYVTLRVNTLKSNTDKIKEILNSSNIKYKEVEWSSEALILEEVDEAEIRKLSIYENGEIYLQSLSSMLPAIVLDPKPDENILDMAAAPGGKTTQMASLSQNKALITACEKNKIRAERLKYNIEKQGANKVNVLIEDARNLDSYFSFDKILLDAPCSGSGTININNEKLENIFTEELINRSVKTQYELLKKAISILKSGHEMVYSTCSLLEEENENNIEKILKNNNIEIVPIDENLFKEANLLPTKLKGTIIVAPNELYEGFFIAKLRK
ncbi:MAG: RsmB/NOP family class I SAM-dependent RNA methyltransferase [Clostridia bacterium]|nr:RsmB/NOP family class I SAM-dependent RNA methyltransferase [Clostridia bacterium]